MDTETKTKIATTLGILKQTLKVYPDTINKQQLIQLINKIYEELDLKIDDTKDYTQDEINKYLSFENINLIFNKIKESTSIKNINEEFAGYLENLKIESIQTYTAEYLIKKFKPNMTVSNNKNLHINYDKYHDGIIDIKNPAPTPQTGGKHLGRTQKNSKKSNSKRTEPKRANSKKANSKKANSKRTGSKKANSKKANSKKTNSKRTNKKNTIDV